MDSEPVVGMDVNSSADTVGLAMDPALSLSVVEPSAAVMVDCGQPAVPWYDWESIEIQEEMEEQGRVELCSEDQVYALLGFRLEDEAAEQMAREGRPSARAGGATASGIPNVEGTEGAAIPVEDYIPEETVFAYDKDNPSMALGTMYPSMEEFRLAMRQYAINKEFELGIEKTCQKVYRGYCKGDGCPWAIVGRRQADNVTVMVTVLNDVHECTSSSRRRTTTPSLNVERKRKGFGIAVWFMGRKPRINTTKGWIPKELRQPTNVTTPQRPENTRDQIMQESPGVVTRRRLAMLMGEGTSQEASSSPTPQTTTTTAPKKMTPKKARRNLGV